MAWSIVRKEFRDETLYEVLVAANLTKDLVEIDPRLRPWKVKVFVKEVQF